MVQKNLGEIFLDPILLGLKFLQLVLFCCYFLVEEKFVLKKKVQKMFGQTKMGSKEILGPRVQKILGKKIFWAKEVLS